MIKKKPENKPYVYSALEAAKICGVVNQTAINWINAGYLKAFKTPGGQFRIYPEDLVNFMKSRCMKIPYEVMKAARFSEKEAKKRTILIIDDDHVFNDVTKKYLDLYIENATVVQAFDGFEAGAKLVEIKPRILVLDIDLPGIDGIKLCKRIFDSEIFGSVDIIVVTGLEQEGLEEQCIALGVKKFIKKPLDLPDLVDVINDLL